MTTGVPPTVYVVDDDPSVRKSLPRLLRAHGFPARAFSSADQFLKSAPCGGPSCLILDVCMPGMGGMELQATLNSLEERNMPVIFVTGHADVPMSVKAMKAGAVDFLTKPFEDKALLSAIDKALEKGTRDLLKRASLKDIKTRLCRLTARELDVFKLVVTGMLNKQIAGELGIAEKTVKVHRGRVMEKMKAGSVAELVRLAQCTGI
jgi:FixJ family two-component response regulator